MLPFHVHNECPANLIFVPTRLRTIWNFTVPASGQLNTRQTLDLIKGRFWWPSMAQGINTHIASCGTCAQAKVPRHHLTGKTHTVTHTTMPLVAHRARFYYRSFHIWGSHNDLRSGRQNFVGNQADPQLSQAFRYYGILVSDRGPQFISRVWSALMEKLAETVSLSFGYHPQANGQVDHNNQEISVLPLCRIPEWLGMIHPMGRVCAELT